MADYLKRASNASLPVRPEAGTLGRRTSGCAACSRSRRTCSAGTTTILPPAGPARAIDDRLAAQVLRLDLGTAEKLCHQTFLLRLGITNFTIPACFGRRRTRGFIDMVVIDDGVMLGVEVDRLTPRERSVLKLRVAQLNCRLMVLTHPQATEQSVAGIDAVVPLEQRNFWNSGKWNPGSPANL